MLGYLKRKLIRFFRPQLIHLNNKWFTGNDLDG